MSDSSLLPRYRDLLRAFRHADAERAQAEAEAEARRKGNHDSIENVSKQAREIAASQLADALKAKESVQPALARVNLSRLLEKTAPLAVFNPRADVHAAQELAQNAAVAKETPAHILSGADALQRWRQAAARHRYGELWLKGEVIEMRTLRGHTDGVNSVAFSPDGRLLASGSADVKLWDVTSGQEVHTLRGYTDARRYLHHPAEPFVLLYRYNIFSVAFSPDGRLLASGGSDHQVKLWDVASWQELRTLGGHVHYVHSVAFSPDGRLLASGSWDNTVKLWGLK